ncbi:cobalt transporter [Thermosipho melanesiensis]|uniref:Cobalt transport protein n=2 Tax=Thermosipho melanesiensis TaxID=46541 RepID=A6LKX7_THEM4|nr:CbiQ family ECF transporter T component [Thermosipho melanesiensis]ABR30578.1 cobalt transport protein [Thermosipho melanesiensis BI429]APT73726.1 cobalt transporter [Thermosipho melanesiensis]OOC35664.1 cobalt transporter [Thermosipho melanesiensis]OOC38963.1 cobalt transporter [Thermosipho melanesiensis]OOC39111.1 cobalt transporter [Thermosipho melanesiensis]
MIIEKISYTNSFSNYHPFPKILFSLSLLFLTFWFSPIINLITVFTVISLLLYTKVPPKKLFNIFLGVFLFIFLTSIALFFDFSEITPERGTSVFLRSCAGVSSILFLVLTTPVFELISLIPNRTIKDMLFLIYRAIYILLNITNEIILSQNSRYGYSTPKNTINSLKYLTYGIFNKALYFSKESEKGLISRFYSNNISILNRFNTKKDISLIFIAEMFLIYLEVII